MASFGSNRWWRCDDIPDPSGVASVVESLKGLVGTTFTDTLPEKISLCTDSLEAELDKLYKKTPTSVSKEIDTFRTSFEELLKSAKVERLVVLVDDLDRCLPATAIDTLEAIRLFLFVPGTAFIFAVDEAMIAYAVRNHFPDLPASVGPSDYAKNYLEKLVQVPFRIPPMGKAETRTYITLLLAEDVLSDDPIQFNKILDTAKKTFSRPWEGGKLNDQTIKESLGTLPEDVKNILLLVNRIYMPLAEGLKGNPRQIKRFLNTFKVRQRIATAQGISDLIDEHILAKLMLLERFEESLYKDLIIRSGQSENGTAAELTSFEDCTKKGGRVAGKEDTLGAKGKFPSEWLKNEWFLRWVNIEPSFRDIDLRPYIFISREKIAGFTRDSGLGDELDEIARKLASGQSVIINSVKKALESLTDDDARKVFGFLADKARQSSTWKNKPKEMDGLYKLTAEKDVLQDSLVELLESIPVKELGTWAATGMKPVLRAESAKTKFDSLLERWKGQAENPSLRSAVEKLSLI